MLLFVIMQWSQVDAVTARVARWQHL